MKKFLNTLHTLFLMTLFCTFGSIVSMNVAPEGLFLNSEEIDQLAQDVDVWESYRPLEFEAQEAIHCLSPDPEGNYLQALKNELTETNSVDATTFVASRLASNYLLNRPHEIGVIKTLLFNSKIDSQDIEQSNDTSKVPTLTELCKKALKMNDSETFKLLATHDAFKDLLKATLLGKPFNEINSLFNNAFVASNPDERDAIKTTQDELIKNILKKFEQHTENNEAYENTFKPLIEKKLKRSANDSEPPAKRQKPKPNLAYLKK